MKLGFIGTGNLAAALITGMSKSYEIFAYEKMKDKLDDCRIKYGVKSCASVSELAECVDVIIIAIKPVSFDALAVELRQVCGVKPIISTMASLTLERITEALGGGLPVARVMPNINAAVGGSATALCVNENMSDEQSSLITDVFSAVGTVFNIDESLFDVIFALGGSGPAFVYLFINSLAMGAVKMGMDKKTAVQAAAQMVLGSAKLLMETKSHPCELVDRVCSPGGMTIEGINILEENGFNGIVMNALQAAVLKAKKMV